MGPMQELTQMKSWLFRGQVTLLDPGEVNRFLKVVESVHALSEIWQRGCWGSSYDG